MNRHGVSHVMTLAWRGVVLLPGRVLILGVRGYQLLISPWLGQHCRFTPSCSQYFIEAVKKHGAIRGSLKGTWRICRCHPFQPGGHDPP
jgi:putative membrane protein insertion efficiency factor